MKTFPWKLKAYLLGLQDARQGKVFRHHANPGSWVRNYLTDYDRGWKKGRSLR